MANNPTEQRQDPKNKNTHNFSWFPSILLIFQLFLLLFELFNFNHQIVDSFNQFLHGLSLFLSIINSLFIVWYWIKDRILEQTDISNESKIINSCICIFGIILLNKLYDNNRLNEALVQ